MKYGIIYCPKSSITATNKMKMTVEECFKSRGMDYILYHTSKEKTVQDSVAAAVAAGCQTLVVVGGDRSLNSTVNAILRMPETVRAELKLGVIPYGTINAFSGYWGLRDSTLEDCVDYIQRGKVRKIDAGCIHYTDKTHTKQERYFLNCINIGLSAHITRVRHNTHSILWSRKLSFLVSTLILIFQRSVYRMKFNLNHEDVDENFMTLCIGNCTGYGQTPSAVPYNGWLDVSAVSITPLSGIAMGFYLLLTGKFLKHKNVKPYRTKRVLFHKVPSSAVSVDGAMISTPQDEFLVDIHQEVVNFIIPYRK